MEVYLVVHAAEHSTHVFVAGKVEDEEVDRHDDPAECAAADGRLLAGVEVVDDDGEVEVAGGAEVAAGAGAEGDDAEGVGRCDDALDGSENFFLGDAGVELDGRGCHGMPSLFAENMIRRRWPRI